MFFQFIYPDNKDTNITAVFGWGFHMYWKASDIVKMFYLKNTYNALKKYLPQEFVFRYELDDRNVVIFIDSVQVLRFMDNIPPPKHQNHSFKSWLRKVIEGNQTLYSKIDLSVFSNALNYPDHEITIILESVYNKLSSSYTLPEIISNIRKRNLPYKVCTP